MAIISTNVDWKVIFSEQRQDILKYNGGNGGRDSEGSGVFFSEKNRRIRFFMSDVFHRCDLLVLTSDVRMSV